MAISFPWTCPYCNRDATITQSNYSSDTHNFDRNNRLGYLGLRTYVVVCPNDACREPTIQASLHHLDSNGNRIDNPILSWLLRPRSSARTFPQYIPAAILADYEEACLVQDLSPKASATLSRRCLQGIIRDFWGISKNRLVDEINDLKGKVEPTTWKAIDAVRSIGNIGAHMEKDIDVIVDVEPEEAELLTGLIEILLKDWYIARHERDEHLSGIVAAAESKKQAKDGIAT